MTVSFTVRLHRKGSITLPIAIRRKYRMNEGDVFTLIDLGDGSFLITPIVTQVDRFGKRIADALEAEGISIDEIMTALDEERDGYYQERNVEN